MNNGQAFHWAYEPADARVPPAGRPTARRGERGHDGGWIHVLCPARAGLVGAPAGSAWPAGHHGTAAGLGRPWHRTRSRGLLGHLHPADPACRRPGHRPQRAGRLHPGGRHRGAACRRFPRTARGDLAAACRHAGAGRAASRPAVQPGIPRPATPHRQRLRHPDEPGTRLRPAGRPARPRAGPERGSRRWHPLRGHRRNRGYPHRRPNAPAP